MVVHVEKLEFTPVYGEYLPKAAVFAVFVKVVTQILVDIHQAIMQVAAAVRFQVYMHLNPFA